jgi:hypothetical protein
MVKQLRERALGDGLLTTVGYSFRCHDDIILLLIMETVEQKTFEAIKKCAEHRIPFFMKRPLALHQKMKNT